MPKSVAMSCPLCLSVNDPADTLPMTMAHSSFALIAPLHLCRRCVLEIMKSAVASELIDPGEVFPDAPASSSNDRAADSVAAPATPIDPLVLGDSYVSPTPELDRLESEVPAGGEDRGSKGQEG